MKPQIITLKAPAKFNLNIHVFPKKNPEDLFPVHYLMCQLALSDELEFVWQPKEITLMCESSQVPKDRTNLVLKAAHLIKLQTGDQNLGVKIALKKNIPVTAGFGGGSSDAATTIKALQELWKISLNKKQIAELAGQLGQEVYYCLVGGVCEVRGTGEIVIPLSYKVPSSWVVLVTPKEHKQSTGWTFQNLDQTIIGKHQNMLEKLKEGLKKKDKQLIFKNLFNEFESVIFKHFPKVENIKNEMSELGAQASIMTGAGNSIVGFFPTKISAQKAQDTLSLKYKQVILTKTI